MSARACTVSYGDEIISFEVIERPARRTLGIEVHPDGRVLVLVPAGRYDAIVEEKIQRRASWISRQLAMFSRYERHTAPRQYLSGESHLYLGRQHRLRIVANDENLSKAQVKLTRGEILVASQGPLPTEKVKELLRRWYLVRAREIYAQVLDDVFDVFARQGNEKPRISVREMRSRWGSLSPGGQMTLNSRLVKAPRPCIEYVIVHELCHITHRDHDAGFYSLLGKIMPDWPTRKHRLEKSLL